MFVLAIFVLEFVAQVFSDWKSFNFSSLFFWLDLLAIGITPHHTTTNTQDTQIVI